MIAYDIVCLVVCNWSTQPYQWKKVSVMTNIRHIFWIFIFLVVFCSRNTNCDDDEKFKRDISGGYFFNSDVLRKDEKKVQGKTESTKDSLFMSPLSYVFGSLGLSLDNIKTSVEYWPPDMDKDKFQKAWESQDTSFLHNSWFNTPVVESVPIKSEPEIIASYDHTSGLSGNYDYDFLPSTTTPTPTPEQYRKPKKVKSVEIIPIKKPESHRHRPTVVVSESYRGTYVKSTPEPVEIISTKEKGRSEFPIAVDYNYNFIQSSTQPPVNDIIYVPSSTTEDSLFPYYNAGAMENAGPIVFPTIEPPAARSSAKHFIAPVTVVPRANKKRKLKKKAKTSSPVTQFNIESQVISHTQPMSAITDETTTAKTSFQHTPSYVIDNEPVHYTDIINNLSNLTEMAYGSGTGNNDKHEKEVKDVYVKIGYKKQNRYSSKVVLNDFDIPSSSTTHSSFVISVAPEDKEEFTEKHDASDYQTTGKEVLTTAATRSPPPSTVRAKKLKSTSDASNIENAIDELKKAIDEYDAHKVRSIIHQYENRSSVASIMNAMVLSASIKADKEKSAHSTATASYSETSSSSPKVQHRSRFGSNRNLKPKYFDALKIDQHSTTPTHPRTPSSSSIASSSYSSSSMRPKISLKFKATASSKLETSTSKKSSSNSSSSTTKAPAALSSSPATIKSRKFASTARQYTPKANKSRQISKSKQSTTTKSQTVRTTTTVRSRRSTKKVANSLHHH
jgi:hypothetical protein